MVKWSTRPDGKISQLPYCGKYTSVSRLYPGIDGIFETGHENGSSNHKPRSSDLANHSSERSMTRNHPVMHLNASRRCAIHNRAIIKHPEIRASIQVLEDALFAQVSCL